MKAGPGRSISRNGLIDGAVCGSFARERSVRARVALLGLLAGGVILGLFACTGSWFATPGNATLIVGTPILAGAKGEVLVSAANMPAGGLASIAVDDLGITHTNIAPASIRATGLNGFTVLAQDFATTPGKGRLVAVNPTSGSVGGTILKIAFNTSGETPTFRIQSEDKGKVTLGSALNTLIATWELGTTKAYYAK
ncbi:MAG: hypothetical protein NT125_04645 [Candidatus Bipolaricaulota bacterium]|nr:hypothetical protein [Candidatus Bipolaricaulota bacterium]